MLNKIARDFVKPSNLPYTRRKYFSVFNKLKDYLKSGVQSTYTIFGSQIDPDKIKVEYEDEVDSKSRLPQKKGVKPSSPQQNEKLSTDGLPTDVIKFERNITLIKQEEKERELLDQMIVEIQKEDTSQHIKRTSKSKFKTIWEKLDTYEQTAEGKIKLPEVSGEDGKSARLFDNMSDYSTWKENKIKELKSNIFDKLTPMEYHIMQGKGCERPYTGDYWDTNTVGIYSCKCCTQRLFSSTHKYNAKGIGHATFWNFLPFTLNFHEDHLDFPTPTQAIYKIKFANSKPKKRITCSNCDSHLGHVFEDGPAPFFKRLNINSSAIHFLDLGWFTSPDELNRRKELSVLVAEQERIEKENTVIQRMKKDHQQLFKHIDKHITDFEKSLTYDVIEEKLRKRDQNTINENKNS